MKLTITLNGKKTTREILGNETLLDFLRNEQLFGSKFGGCKQGECGACTVLIDGEAINSCTHLAIQADGHSIQTIESIGENPERGWKKSKGLSNVQKAFVESGAIQCGYCTPAMVLASTSLLKEVNVPTEEQIRDAISGILCRCTGYDKPVKAIKSVFEKNEKDRFSPLIESNVKEQFQSIGKKTKKVDAIKLVQGKPAFTDDVNIKGMLIAKVLHSTVAHAEIVEINTDEAKNLPGVHAVLTWKDIPRVVYSTAGQSDPIPGPLDMFSLDKKVRFVGDRVAFVAAETADIAEKAIKLIKVNYREIPALFDSSKAMEKDAPILHDEPEYVNFAESDPKKNLAASIRIDIGNVDDGFKEADLIFENTYEVPKVHQAHIEPHVVISYWDEDDRMVIRSSTQVPFHARRILSPVLNIPIKRIRVIKPRIGGGFGGKQEVMVEDVAAHLTIATGRPVKYEYTREEEYTSGRSRHPMKIRLKTGVKKDGTITANEMYALSDTGAYGCHALTVTGNTGHKSMALYVGDGKYRKSPNIRFYADIVYTNHPPAGAYRGYGVPQGYWAVERQMELISRKLGLDAIEFRLKNAIRSGELHPFSTAWSEGREPKPETIHTVNLERCARLGMTEMNWKAKKGNLAWQNPGGDPYLKKGIGVAFAMQGTAIPYLDMGAAIIKMNDDGSFNLLIGATDLGTGSDTVLAQMAAETLGVSTDEIIVYSSDTDFTPFDKGAYASSTTYISGGAVSKAAEIVAQKIKQRALLLCKQEPGLTENDVVLKNGFAITPKGQKISLKDIALSSIHHFNQEQIMGSASFWSPVAPPPFAAQFAEVTVDIQTGKVVVNKLVMAVDAGMIVNPLTASGQIEGGMSQALGYAVCEEMKYDEKGIPREKDLENYHIFRADEMPELRTIFVESFEPTHPFGVKAVAEIPLDGVAPAVGNAIQDACGASLFEIPATPERIWRALNAKE